LFIDTELRSGLRRKSAATFFPTLLGTFGRASERKRYHVLEDAAWVEREPTVRPGYDSLAIDDDARRRQLDGLLFKERD